MNKTSTVTLAAARKRLAEAYQRLDQAVSIRNPGSLGSLVHNLEGGIRTSKQRAVRHARQVVEMMVAKELSRVERLIIQSNSVEDQGFSVIYLAGTEVLLVQHSTFDRVGLGEDRQRQLDSFLLSRKEVV